MILIKKFFCARTFFKIGVLEFEKCDFNPPFYFAIKNELYVELHSCIKGLKISKCLSRKFNIASKHYHKKDSFKKMKSTF